MSNSIITVIQLNDLHGYMEPHQELFWSDDGPVFREAGGIAKISALINEAREQNPDGVIALDNEDTIHGTYPVVKIKGEALKPILNKIGFDAWTAHWDFAYDAPYLKEFNEALGLPAISNQLLQQGKR